MDHPAASVFDQTAATYDQDRAKLIPGYDAFYLTAVRLLPAEADYILDLGAGTGKLTARLAGRELEVVAVEPSDRMRAQLTAELGDGVTALAGSAEAIPLPDGSLDAILVAQAWHWVDPERAVPEVARALRPGGRLGLLWNLRTQDTPWVAALAEILAPADEALRAERRAGRDDAELGPPFGPIQRFTTAPWTTPLTPEGLVELVASRSYVITLAPDRRDALLAQVRQLTREHPDLAHRERIDVPYVTVCLRAERT